MIVREELIQQWIKEVQDRKTLASFCEWLELPAQLHRAPPSKSDVVRDLLHRTGRRFVCQVDNGSQEEADADNSYIVVIKRWDAEESVFWDCAGGSWHYAALAAMTILTNNDKTYVGVN